MKLHRKFTPFKHIIWSVPLLLLLSYNSYNSYISTGNEHWLYVIPALIAAMVLGAAALRKPLVSINNEKIIISGQTIDPNIVVSSKYLKNNKAPDTIVIKMDGFEPHHIPVGERNEDVEDLRVFNFIKQALPTIELDESHSN